MAKSKVDAKIKKRKSKIKIHNQKFNNLKQKLSRMSEKTSQPVTFVYNKDKSMVEVPIKLWQTLNQTAQQLQAIAMFVSTMESIGQIHMQDGTLLPVFSEDLEPSEFKNPDGSPQMKIKDSFWNTISILKPEVPVKEEIVFNASGPLVKENATLEFTEEVKTDVQL